MSHVEFTYPGASTPATLVADGPPAEVDDWLELYLVGPSVGENFKVAHADGTQAMDRDRDELAATLQWVIKGTATLAGASGVGLLKQARANIRDLTRWFDAAPGRQVTVTLDDDELGVWSGVAQHEEFGRLDWQGPTIFVRQLLTFHEGLLTEVVE